MRRDRGLKAIGKLGHLSSGVDGTTADHDEWILRLCDERSCSRDCVEIDRRRERRLRPSVLTRLLSAAQQRPPRFRAEQFLESLANGYELVVARMGKKPDAVMRLTDIWSVLTLLPGQGKEYTRPEFARDLYLLDQSGARLTKVGRALRWHASSGTRTAGVITTVARTGQQQRYWGVSFTAQASDE